MNILHVTHHHIYILHQNARQQPISMPAILSMGYSWLKSRVSQCRVRWLQNIIRNKRPFPSMKHQEDLYLLLAVKSLSQNRKDKRYLLKISSMDHEKQCEVENAFEHGYEYVYKLWPCAASTREFVKIVMMERVDGELVKRGEASPMVRYSAEGQRFQFAGSRQEQCVLILKFRASTLADVEKQLSKRELEKLNDQVELELMKNKHENENYHSYLEYTNRFLDFLDNTKYLDAPTADIIEEESQTSIASTQKISQANKSLRVDTSLLGDFNSRMRKSLQFLSNGRYFNQPSPTNNNISTEKTKLPEIDEDHQQENANQSVQSRSVAPKRQDSEKISTQIRKRRNLYTKPPEEESRQKMTVSEPKPEDGEQVSFEDVSFQSKEPESPPKYQAKSREREVSSPIIRTNDFPLKEVKLQVETSRRNARRRKKANSENKQVADSYGSAIKKIEDVDLIRIFDQYSPKEKAANNLVKIQLFQIKLHLFRGNYDLPKKLVIVFGKNKYQTLPASMKNKWTEWTNYIIIPKVALSASLSFKVVSVNQFSFYDEGEAKTLVNDLMRCGSKPMKVYLNANNIVIGFIEFQCRISPYDPNQEPLKEAHTFRVDKKQRKSVSLPQISQQNKAKQRYRQTNDKGRSGAVSSYKKDNKSKNKRQNQRYATSPDYQSMQFVRPHRDKVALLSKAKQKKMRMKAKIK